VQGWRQAVGVVGSGAGGTRDKMFPVLLAADKTVLDTGSLVDAFVAIPVPVRNLIDRRLEAVSVITLVATET
jgi:hypothetical protein